jgi:microcystin-dependent protein
MLPYVGEIRMGGWNFAPAGWLLCQGQLLSIAQYQTLFALIGTTYGGDGSNTFALPDLRGRVPMHQGTGASLGQLAGAEQVTLTTSATPAHPHSLLASTDPATQRSPAGNVAGTVASGSIYSEIAITAQMSGQSIGAAPGNGQPHYNMQPYLGLTFIIAVDGVFPSQG